jgi:hypothetical protein
MSRNRTVKEQYRRNPNLRTKEVRTVLPLYFQQEYPNLVSFLETYYELDSRLNEDYFALRDLEETTLAYLDRLFFEFGNNSTAEEFSDPRFVGKIIHEIIQNKGNEYSTQLFFRLFFNEIPEISYPKDNLFIVAESPLNDQFHLIQNGLRLQFLSVLIKTGIPFSRWESLYRQFIHSAGYYLSAEVLLEGIARMNLTAPIAIADSDAGTFTISEIGSFTFNGVGELDFLFDSATNTNSTTFILSDESMDKYKGIDIGILDAQYESIIDLRQSSSPRMSEDSDGTFKSPYSSSTIETMDRGYRDSSYQSSFLINNDLWLLNDGEWNDSASWYDVQFWEDSEGTLNDWEH